MKKIKLLMTLSSIPILGMITAPLTNCGGGEKKDLEHWTVTFNCDAGATLSGETSIKVDKDSKWSAIPKPTINPKDEYTSLGWYKGSEPITDDFIISSDLIVTAKTEKCTPSTNFTWSYDTSNFSATLEKYSTITSYDVIIPSKITNLGKQFTVTKIADGAFENTNITSIVIPEKVEYIGKNAFANDKGLVSAKILSSEINWSLINDDDCLDWKISDETKNAKALVQGSSFYWVSGIVFCNDSWENITKYANQGLEVLKTKYNLSKFGYDSFVGFHRKIKINGMTHWVRVIGENHDDLSDGSGKATLTFELVTLLSDSTGNKILTYFNNSERTSVDYTTSDLRKNLNGLDGKTWDKSVLEILSEEEPALYSNIKTVKKTTHRCAEHQHTEKKQYDEKLFLLTYYEMAQNDSKVSPFKDGTPYEFWLQHTDQTSRIKSDVLNTPYVYIIDSTRTPSTPEVTAKPYLLGVNTDGSFVDRPSEKTLTIQIPSAISFAFCI